MSASPATVERQALKEFVQTHSQLGQLAQLEAVLDQGEAIAGIARVRAAQEAAAIRQLNPHAPATPENEMRTIVFGDMIQQPPAFPTKPALGTLAKLGIAAALLASGVGAGAAIPLAIDALRSRPAAVAPTNTHTTTERDYQVGEITIE